VEREWRDEAVPVWAAIDQGLAGLLPDIDEPDCWLLTVNDAAQSYVDMGDPTHLEFEYARRLGHVVDLAEPDRVLHLGAGALTLPRYIAARRPDSRQLVVDVDPALVEFVERQLPWKPANIEVAIADARAAIAERPDGQTDLVIADVFTGERIPAHVTSVEFLQAVRKTLAPNAWYAANLADGGRLEFVGGQVANLLSLFTHGALIAEPAVLRGRRFGNVLLLGSDNELPIGELQHRVLADAFPARVVADDELRELATEVVTDATARNSPDRPPSVFQR
jgi:hypothetical protein